MAQKKFYSWDFLLARRPEEASWMSGEISLIMKYRAEFSLAGLGVHKKMLGVKTVNEHY